MELNRRDFLKGSLAFGGVAALGGLAGCATPQQASNDSAKDAKPEKKSVPDSFTDGKWIGSAMGHDDDLFVQVTVAGGDIAGISVLRCDDTIGIGSTAAPMMATRILEAKNIDVDTVTGATTTSMAVQSAVADATKRRAQPHIAAHSTLCQIAGNAQGISLPQGLRGLCAGALFPVGPIAALTGHLRTAIDLLQGG